MKYTNTNGELMIAKIVTHAVVLILAIVLIFSSFGTVGAGERGIKTRFGAVTGKVFEPGLYFKLPFIEQVVEMNVQTQKDETGASASSSDLQMVNTTIAINYSVDPTQVTTIYKTIGVDFKNRVIDPAIQENVKAVTANFTAEQLVTKREEVRDLIQQKITDKLKTFGILVESFSIVNFNFSKSFNEAIEAKVTAEQNALASKNKLEQVKYEAQQAVEKAKGNADSIRIEASALQQNPNVLKLREIENQSKAIEKWSGNLPNVTGGALPFINVQ